MTVTVRVTGRRLFAVRRWVAVRLIMLAGRVLNVGKTAVDVAQVNVQ